jgi:hypothetical protein
VSRFLTIIVTIGFIVVGCAHLRPGTAQTAGPTGAPVVQEILADLAQSYQAITDFRAAATITFVPGKHGAAKRFNSGKIAYRRPSDLRIVGRLDTGTAGFELTSASGKFEIALPTEAKRFYQESKLGTRPRRISPSDIAEELFGPEIRPDTGLGKIRLLAYDAENHTAVLEIRRKLLLTRRLTVSGPRPWTVARSELLKHGHVVISIRKSRYQNLNSVPFPARMEAELPAQGVSLILDMRNIRLNTGLPDSLFVPSAPETALEAQAN